jgi:hypothetical protein
LHDLNCKGDIEMELHTIFLPLNPYNHPTLLQIDIVLRRHTSLRLHPLVIRPIPLLDSKTASNLTRVEQHNTVELALWPLHHLCELRPHVLLEVLLDLVEVIFALDLAIRRLAVEADDHVQTRRHHCVAAGEPHDKKVARDVACQGSMEIGYVESGVGCYVHIVVRRECSKSVV